MIGEPRTKSLESLCIWGISNSIWQCEHIPVLGLAFLIQCQSWSISNSCKPGCSMFSCLSVHKGGFQEKKLQNKNFGKTSVNHVQLISTFQKNTRTYFSKQSNLITFCSPPNVQYLVGWHWPGWDWVVMKPSECEKCHNCHTIVHQFTNL